MPNKTPPIKQELRQLRNRVYYTLNADTNGTNKKSTPKKCPVKKKTISPSITKVEESCKAENWFENTNDLTDTTLLNKPSKKKIKMTKEEAALKALELCNEAAQLQLNKGTPILKSEIKKICDNIITDNKPKGVPTKMISATTKKQASEQIPKQKDIKKKPQKNKANSKQAEKKCLKDKQINVKRPTVEKPKKCTKTKNNKKANSLTIPIEKNVKPQKNNVNTKSSLNSETLTNTSVTSSTFRTSLSSDKTKLSVSRRTSMSDAFSWTKDISSSTATSLVSVSSNDFYRIDKRLPVVILSDVESEISHKNNKNTSISKQSITNVTTNKGVTGLYIRKRKRHDKWLMPNKKRPKIDKDLSAEINSSTFSLSLSSSTTESSNAISNSTDKQEVKDIFDSLGLKRNNNGSENFELSTKQTRNLKHNINTVKMKLKSFDPEFFDWVDHILEQGNTAINEVDFSNSPINVLKNECKVIERCNNGFDSSNDSLKSYLSKDTKRNSAQIPIESLSFLKPANVRICQPSKKTIDNSSKVQKTTDNSSKVQETVDNSSNVQNLDETDNIDDDCISLFAESINFFENNNNNSVPSVDNDHNKDESFCRIPKIPQIKKIKQTETQLTKNLETNPRVRSETVCSEDKTDFDKSNTKELTRKEVDSPRKEAQIIEDKSENSKFMGTKPEILSYNNINNTYNRMPLNYSKLFVGICFRYLYSSCPYEVTCRFPHKELEVNEVTNRLSAMNNHEQFIREYKLIRSKKKLTLKYMDCFVADCARRGFPRLLIEMGIDIFTSQIILSTQETQWKRRILENILLYINNINIAVCEDLLLINVAENCNICDVFMNIISESQNFLQFTNIFIKLTNFITRINRFCELNVTSQILERVCLLPYQETLMKSVMILIFNTESKIFDNPFVKQFETIICSKNNKLFNEYVQLKNMVFARMTNGNNDVQTESPPEANEGPPQKSDTTLSQLNIMAGHTSPNKSNVNTNVAKTPSILNLDQMTSFNEPVHKPGICNRNTNSSQNVFNNVLLPHGFMRPPPPRPRQRQFNSRTHHPWFYRP